MKLHTLKRTRSFAQPRESVFKFFESPEHLALITPPWLDFRILTPAPVVMRQGALIDYTIRWLTFPVRWTTLITTYDPPFRFVDEQIRGPYSLWHHSHTFTGKDDFTEMTDEVRYVLPYGPLGDAFHALIVRKQLETIFDYRSEVIGRFFAETPNAGEQGKKNAYMEVK